MEVGQGAVGLLENPLTDGVIQVSIKQIMLAGIRDRCATTGKANRPINGFFC